MLSSVFFVRIKSLLCLVLFLFKQKSLLCVEPGVWGPENKHKTRNSVTIVLILFPRGLQLRMVEGQWRTTTDWKAL